MRLSKGSTMVFATAFVACFALVGIGCSDSKPSVPKAAIRGQIGPGTEKGVNDTLKCNLKTEAWAVVGNVQNEVISDGDSVDGARLGVDCIVKPEGDGYYVQASGLLESRQSFSVHGHFTKSGDQTDLSGALFDRNTGTFRQDTGCTGTIQTTKDGPGIKAGAVWANIKCPHAALTSDTTRVCEVTADYRFENCTQE